MIERAFVLLRFDEDNIAKSMRRLTTHGHRICRDRGVAGRLLVTFIDDATRRMDAADLVGDDKKNYEVLWSALFNTAVCVRDWEKAHGTCVNHPNVVRKADSFNRLVRAMVDAGALEDLLTMCSSLSSEPVSEGYGDVYRNVVDFYGIAAETLSELGVRDIYMSMAVEQEPRRAQITWVHSMRYMFRRANGRRQPKLWIVDISRLVGIVSQLRCWN